MKDIRLSLLVLRVADIEKGAQFYSALGMEFTKHSHGKGPEHFAAEIGGVVFEIYPLVSEDSSTRHVRLGFAVADPELTLAALQAKGAKIVSALKDSPWGLRAVLDDPFGHRIEITKSK
jgi:lactoylglutathione lyase